MGSTSNGSGAMTRTRSPNYERSGIIRNRRKIVATVGNANAFRDIQTSYGSFDDYIWRFTGRHVIYETGMTTSLCPTPSQWISRRTACDSSAPPSSTPICNPSASSMHMSLDASCTGKGDPRKDL